MTFGLKNKNIFITGSTSGIGLGIAQKLMQYGAKIAINSKNKNSLEKAKKFFDSPIYCILGDMRSADGAKKSINEFIDEFKSIDILICNVGSGRSSFPLKESISDWEKSISLNLFSTINPISESIDYLSKSSGTITCISSICGEKMIEGAPLTYSSAKAALNRYIANSSFYLAKKNIRINAVSPGNVMFPGSIWDKKLKEDPKAVQEMLNNKVPLKKFVTIDDVSEVVAFLSSPLSNSVTGQIINVDGGQSIF